MVNCPAYKRLVFLIYMSTKTAAVNQNVFTLLFSQIRDFGANFEKSTPGEDTEKPRTKLSVPKIKFNLPKDKFLQKAKDATAFLKRRPKMAIGVGLGLLVIIFVLVFFPGVNPNSAVKKVAGSQTDFSPENQVTIGSRFEVPIRKEDGTETPDKLIINLTTADLSKKILIQGKPATSRDTKTFILINFEVENSTSNQLTVRPVDFIRLTDAEGRTFAPDVHNNDVAVEPISIKKTRVGFVVDENQKEFKFLVGEINGPKKEVIVKFN